MARDSDRLDRIIDPAVETLAKVFRGEAITEEQITAAKLAVTAIGAWTRLKQAERAQEGLYFNMAALLASDKEELKQYIRLSMPHVPLLRALDARQEPKPKSLPSGRRKMHPE